MSGPVEETSVIVLTVDLPGRTRYGPTPSQLRDLTTHSIRARDLRGWSDERLEPYVDNVAAEQLYGQPLSGAQVGCALSHLDAYRYLLTTANEWALVMEDDAILAPQVDSSCLKELVRILGQRGPAIVALYSRLAPKWLAPRLGRVGCCELLQSPCILPGTVAYLINRDAAGLAVASASRERIAFRADWPAWAAESTFLFTSPWLCTHNDSMPSTMPEGQTERPLRRIRRSILLLSGLGFTALSMYYGGDRGLFFRHVTRPRLARAFGLLG